MSSNITNLETKIKEFLTKKNYILYKHNLDYILCVSDMNVIYL